MRDWAAYDRALARRGDVTVWVSPDATAGWRAPAGRRTFSDAAIAAALMVRAVFRLACKVHIEVDPNSGTILAEELTRSDVHDSVPVPALLSGIEGDLGRVYGDGAYATDRCTAPWPGADSRCPTPRAYSGQGRPTCVLPPSSIR